MSGMVITALGRVLWLILNLPTTSLTVNNIVDFIPTNGLFYLYVFTGLSVARFDATIVDCVLILLSNLKELVEQLATGDSAQANRSIGIEDEDEHGGIRPRRLITERGIERPCCSARPASMAKLW